MILLQFDVINKFQTIIFFKFYLSKIKN